MVRKIIGILVVVAVIVIIVVAALRRHGFQSMVLRDEILNQELPAPVAPAEQPAGLSSGTVEVIDSVTVQVTDSVR